MPVLVVVPGHEPLPQGELCHALLQRLSAIRLDGGACPEAASRGGQTGTAASPLSRQSRYWGAASPSVQELVIEKNQSMIELIQARPPLPAALAGVAMTAVRAAAVAITKKLERLVNMESFLTRLFRQSIMLGVVWLPGTRKKSGWKLPAAAQRQKQW